MLHPVGGGHALAKAVGPGFLGPLSLAGSRPGSLGTLDGNPDSLLADVFSTSIIHGVISDWRSEKPGQWFSGQTSSITTTAQRGMPGDARRALGTLCMGALARSLQRIPACPQATAATHPARTVSRAAFRQTGPRDPGHLPPNLLQAGRPRQQAQGHVVETACPGCGSRTYPGPRRSSPSRTPFLHATGILLPTPQRGIFRSLGPLVAGLAAVQR